MSTAARKMVLACALSLLMATGARSEPQRVLSIITSADAEAQALALILANEARAAGHAVSVLLCSAGGNIARKDAPESASRVVTPKGMNVKMLLAGLIKQGGQVDVCAIYLPNRKLTKDALIEG